MNRENSIKSENQWIFKDSHKAEWDDSRLANTIKRKTQQNLLNNDKYLSKSRTMKNLSKLSHHAGYQDFTLKKNKKDILRNSIVEQCFEMQGNNIFYFI